MLRGRGTSSRGTRGASTSSRGSSSRGRGKAASASPLSTVSNASSSGSIEEERLDNAAKRQQSERQKISVNSGGLRGSVRGRGTFANKSVRFADPPAERESGKGEKDTVFGAPTTGAMNVAASSPFGGLQTDKSSSTPSNSFGIPPKPFANVPVAANPSAFNPFAASNSTKTPSPFGTSPSNTPSQAPSIFGAPSQPNSDVSKANPFMASPFSSSNPFQNSSAQTSTTKTIFGTPSATLSSFGRSDPASATLGSFKIAETTLAAKRPVSENGQAHNDPGHSEGGGGFITQTQSSALPFSTLGSLSKQSAPIPRVKNKLAEDIETLLQKRGLSPPPWPTKFPGNPSQKGQMESFWQEMKGYRAKVRVALISSGQLDDPDKPKKLSEAIDFKGICEDMCPDFEKITRIVEHDVQGPEKELAPDGQSLWPSPAKMIKALARSAAGQDAPLPQDVRSPAALRRTLDYLISTILGPNPLPAVHGFLWDRTRAIRRDFVFQQASMNADELLDQVYCLERITRFHVIALHQMSRADVVADDFVEQQEVEQLGKALLSLTHAYEDCKIQGLPCENEAEFRAFYIIFNSHNPGILEAVQDWGYGLWKSSDKIQTAISLVEALQNVWDALGPLRPHLAMDVAQNAFSRFFTIIKDKKVSYTMACFAEIHFNKVRKAALKTILGAYRKQKDQSKDWTLSRLNTYLHFDDENDIIPFGEAYGMTFEVVGDNDVLVLLSDDVVQDPFPKLKQNHSINLVERKRGNRTLPEVINQFPYEDTGGQGMDSGPIMSSTTSTSDRSASYLPPTKASSFITHSPLSPFQSATSLNSTLEPVQKPTDSFSKPGSLEIETAATSFSGASLFNTQTPTSNTTKPIPFPSSKNVWGTASQTPGSTATSSSIFSLPGSTTPADGSSKNPGGSVSGQFFLPSFAKTAPVAKQKPEASASYPFSSLNTSINTTSVTGNLEISGTSSLSGQGTSTATPATMQALPSTSTPSLFSFSSQSNGSLNPGFMTTSPSSSTLKPPDPAVASPFTSTTTNELPAQTSSFSGLASSPAVPAVHNMFTAPSMFSTANSTELGGLGSGMEKVSIPPTSIQGTSFLTTSNLSPLPTPPAGHLRSADNPSAALNSTFPAPTVAQEKPNPIKSSEPPLDVFARWLAFGEGGIVDEFVEVVVECSVEDAVREYKKEVRTRQARLEKERTDAEVSNFRYRSLATKYGHKWRVNAHHIWLKRQGQEAREARRLLIESHRAVKKAEMENIVSDFRASRIESRGASVESMPSATGVLDGVRRPHRQARDIVRRSSNERGKSNLGVSREAGSQGGQMNGTSSKSEEGQNKRKRSRNSGHNTLQDAPTSRQSISSSVSRSDGHRRNQSDFTPRKSVLDDFPGSSRIHLLSKYNPGIEKGHSPSGVQTDYFRLKARGITTLSDGTPLASSAALRLSQRQSSFDSSSRYSTPPRSIQPISASVPAKSRMDRFGLARTSAKSDKEFEAIKERARRTIEGDRKGNSMSSKRVLDEDDDELFAKAKRIREQMDEGADFFRAELLKESVTQSES